MCGRCNKIFTANLFIDEETAPYSKLQSINNTTPFLVFEEVRRSNLLETNCNVPSTYVGST